jgi:hypothetical protein
MSAEAHTVMQLNTPCNLAEAGAWWEGVLQVFSENPGDAEVTIVTHTDGTPRITVHAQEEIEAQ